MEYGKEYDLQLFDGRKVTGKYRGVRGGMQLFEDVITLHIISVPAPDVAILEPGTEPPVEPGETPAVPVPDTGADQTVTAFDVPSSRTQAPTLICDFDKTLFHYDSENYPEIGDPIDGMAEMLQRLKSEGWRIIVQSCRAADEMKDALDAAGYPYDGINEDPENPNPKSPKPFGDAYLDDKGVCFSGDPEAAYQAIKALEPKQDGDEGSDEHED